MFDEVSAVYIITYCYLIDPEISARSLPSQSLVNLVHPSAKYHIFNFDP